MNSWLGKPSSGLSTSWKKYRVEASLASKYQICLKFDRFKDPVPKIEIFYGTNRTHDNNIPSRIAGASFIDSNAPDTEFLLKIHLLEKLQTNNETSIPV